MGKSSLSAQKLKREESKKKSGIVLFVLKVNADGQKLSLSERKDECAR